MNIDKGFRFVCLGLLALGLSGCVQSKATITSNKLETYHANIQRFLMLTDLSRVLSDDQQAIFATNFTDSLSKCGIAAEVHKHDPLALGNDSQEAVRAFTPDTVMTLQWKSASSVGGGPMNVFLEGSIIDLTSKRLVWKAQINLVSAWSSPETLAATIVDRLKSESVLSSSCPTPLVPRRGV